MGRRRIDVDIPDEIHNFCVAYLDGLRAVPGDSLYGVYLCGGWAFPEGTARGILTPMSSSVRI